MDLSTGGRLKKPLILEAMPALLAFPIPFPSYFAVWDNRTDSEQPRTGHGKALWDFGAGRGQGNIAARFHSSSATHHHHYKAATAEHRTLTVFTLFLHASL